EPRAESRRSSDERLITPDLSLLISPEVKMSTRKINIALETSNPESNLPIQDRIRACLTTNTEACSEAAAIWARLHYGHASYVDGSLAVESVEFSSGDAGKASLSFDWTFQDGCSDIFREGAGFVEFNFSVADGQLNLTWAWPEQASTADEF
ncbi:MAG: hypothetical protein ACI8P0_006720, partial [Planctomycetaceae bacterium]